MAVEVLPRMLAGPAMDAMAVMAPSWRGDDADHSAAGRGASSSSGDYWMTRLRRLALA